MVISILSLKNFRSLTGGTAKMGPLIDSASVSSIFLVPTNLRL